MDSPRLTQPPHGTAWSGTQQPLNQGLQLAAQGPDQPTAVWFGPQSEVILQTLNTDVYGSAFIFKNLINNTNLKATWRSGDLRVPKGRCGLLSVGSSSQQTGRIPAAWNLPAKGPVPGEHCDMEGILHPFGMCEVFYNSSKNANGKSNLLWLPGILDSERAGQQTAWPSSQSHESSMCGIRFPHMKHGVLARAGLDNFSGPFSSEAGTLRAKGQCRVRREREALWAAATREGFLEGRGRLELSCEG